MVSTLDRCIGLESSRVIDPLLPVGYRLGRFGVVNFDEKRNGIKIFLVDFVKILLKCAYTHYGGAQCLI